MYKSYDSRYVRYCIRAKPGWNKQSASAVTGESLVSARETRSGAVAYDRDVR
jgi:hypothetical protein